MLNWFYKQREYIISLMAVFFLFIGSANATTLIKKNTASTFTYQAVKNDGTPLTSLTNIEMFYSQHFDTGTCTALTSFGSPSTDKGYGIYFGTITAAMANCDYLVIVPTSSTTGFCQYPKNFRTTIADPHFMATTDDGDDIHTTAGAIDTVTTATTTTNLTNNNDKTGYSLAAAQEVTVSSFTSAGQTDIQEALTNQGLTTTIGSSVTAIEVDTSAMDTSAELRTLLTGADVAISTTTPAQIWAYTPTRSLTHLDEDNTTIDLDGTTIGTVTTYTGNTPQTGDSYAIVNNATYGNSALNTAINKISTTTAHIDTSIPQTGDGYGILNHGTYGNSALETLVDDLESRLTAGRAGYLDYLVDISSGVTRLDLDYTTARAASITAIETDTAAMDTATELRILLTGADVPVSTTTPTAIWAFDISANNEPTAGGYAISGSTVAGSGATAQQVWEYATRTLSAFAFNVTVDSTTAAAQADFRSVLIGQGVTTTRAGYWDKLNVTGTLANTDNASSFKADTTTIPSATAALILTTPANKLATDESGRVTVGSNADKTGYSLAAAQEVTVSSFTSNGQADIQEALTNQGLTTTRNGYSDYLVDISTGITNIDANMVDKSTWTAARANKLDYLDMAISEVTATVSVEDIQAGLTAQGYTAARASKIDNLDTTISSRLSLAGYTAPPSVGSISAEANWNWLISLIKKTR